MLINNNEIFLQFELMPDFTNEHLSPHVEAAADTVANLSQCAMRFARVERVPRYDTATRENDAEHSYMLALVATELAAQYYPTLDTGLVSQFSIVHDLIELETGDVPTFALDDKALAAKELAEHTALSTLLPKLSAYTGKLLVRYESQTEPEAQFVRVVDKLLPIVVDIHGEGSMVLHEDYGVHTEAQFAAAEIKLNTQLQTKFPQSDLAFIHAVRNVLASRLAESYSANCQAC